MQRVEDKTEDLIGTRIRNNRVHRLLRSRRDHTPDTLKTILADHVNYPHSICSHTVPEDSPLDRQKTILSLIMDLTTLEMQVCWGNPCESEFHTYRLET